MEAAAEVRLKSWGSKASTYATLPFKKSYKIGYPPSLYASSDALHGFAVLSNVAKI